MTELLPFIAERKNYSMKVLNFIEQQFTIGLASAVCAINYFGWEL